MNNPCTVAFLLATCLLACTGQEPQPPAPGPTPAFEATSMLIHEAEVAGLCASVLTLLERGETERAERLLAMRMESALRNGAEQVPAAKLEEEMALPNLAEAVRRAKAEAEKRGMEPEVLEAAERVLRWLSRTLPAEGTPGHTRAPG